MTSVTNLKWIKCLFLYSCLACIVYTSILGPWLFLERGDMKDYVSVRKITGWRRRYMIDWLNEIWLSKQLYWYQYWNAFTKSVRGNFTFYLVLIFAFSLDLQIYFVLIQDIFFWLCRYRGVDRGRQGCNARKVISEVYASFVL